MSKIWLSVALAALSGALMTLQGSFNSALLKKIGLANMALFVSATGFIVALGTFLAWGRWSKLLQMTKVPWYGWLGGAIGVAIIAGVAYAIRQVSTALAISSIITAQLATALAVDHFGLFQSEQVAMTWLRFLGLAMMITGTYLMARR
ncbi:MAG TPA: DMT family transporter [Bacillota bacterium]